MYSSDNDDTSPDMGRTSPLSPQGGEIYHRINTLLEGDRDHQRSPDSDMMHSISDMLGLNSPRGPFVSNVSLPQSPVGFGRRKFSSSTPFSSQYHYKSEDDIASPSPLRSFQRSFDVGYHSTPNSPMVPRRHQYIHRYDCGSPLTDSSLLNSSTRSLSPPESMASGSCVTDSGISELMGSMSLQNNYSRSGKAEQDFSNLTGMNPLQQSAINLIQRQQQSFQASILSLLSQQQAFSAGAPAMDKQLMGNCQVNMGDGNGNPVERAARSHRNAAAVCDPSYTWSGTLPPRTQRNVVFSPKIFLGGVPWDLSEDTLEQVFHPFGPIRVEWPGKEGLYQPRGFVYIIFESEKQVRQLLANCCKDFANGGSWFYKLSTRRIKSKEVQVIPWAISDCNYAKSTCQKLDPQKTVFVGALHGMVTAEGLAKVMDDLFEGVLHVGIDTDKFKYPIGSARVTFGNNHSYMKAVAAAFIEIKTVKFSKKIQVDPYLEDSFCSECKVTQGPYFCRAIICFRYFCLTCWNWTHAVESLTNHKPVTRGSKNAPIMGFGNRAGTRYE